MLSQVHFGTLHGWSNLLKIIFSHWWLPISKIASQWRSSERVKISLFPSLPCSRYLPACWDVSGSVPQAVEPPIQAKLLLIFSIYKFWHFYHYPGLHASRTRLFLLPTTASIPYLVIAPPSTGVAQTLAIYKHSLAAKNVEKPFSTALEIYKHAILVFLASKSGTKAAWSSASQQCTSNRLLHNSNWFLIRAHQEKRAFFARPFRGC